MPTKSLPPVSANAYGKHCSLGQYIKASFSTSHGMQGLRTRTESLLRLGGFECLLRCILCRCHMLLTVRSTFTKMFGMAWPGYLLLGVFVAMPELRATSGSLSHLRPCCTDSRCIAIIALRRRGGEDCGWWVKARSIKSSPGICIRWVR